jgi:hypothetical protein
MLELRTVCENCEKHLPNECDEAMICSFECTFCQSCVDDILSNVCPNCGGGFEKRPTRPHDCFTDNCIDNYPVSERKIVRPINFDSLQILRYHFQDINPRKR